jgi:hypothetical protein
MKIIAVVAASLGLMALAATRGTGATEAGGHLPPLG